jgi:hypothetical protein
VWTTDLVSNERLEIAHEIAHFSPTSNSRIAVFDPLVQAVAVDQVARTRLSGHLGTPVDHLITPALPDDDSFGSDPEHKRMGERCVTLMLVLSVSPQFKVVYVNERHDEHTRDLFLAPSKRFGTLEGCPQ